MSEAESDELHVATIVLGFVIPLISLIVLSVSEYRRTGKKYRVAAPIDFLKDDHLILPYAAAFGVVSSALMYLVINGRDTTNRITVSAEVKPWIKVPFWLLDSLLISFQYYPIFAAIRHKTAIVGPVIGLVCGSFLTYANVYVVVITSNEGENANPNVNVAAFLVMLQLPDFLCIIYLLVFFIYNLIRDVRSKFIVTANPFEKESEIIKVNGYERKYVKWIFQKHKNGASKDSSIHVPTVQDCAKTAKKILQLGSLTNASLRIVSTFVVCIIIIYKLLVQVAFVCHISDFKQTFLSYAGSFVSQNASSWDSTVSQLSTLADVLDASLYLSLITTTVTMLVYTVLIYRTYKKDLERMYMGDFSFLPPKIQNRKQNDFVFQSIKYSGVQIAFMFWCYIFVFLSCLLLCFALAYGFILPILQKVPSFFLVPVKAFAPLFIARFLFNLVELKFITARFVQKKQNEHLGDKDDRTLLALKNRNSFNVIAYFLFFYHAIIGFIGCISRILFGGLIGIFTVARLDGCRLPRGFENFDTGYSTYVGLIMLELYHRNPILLVFCDELLQTTKNGGIDLSDVSLQIPNERIDYQINVSKTMNQKSSRRIRNRWRKAVTLLNNESLCKNSKASENKSELDTVYESIFW